ncbi:tropomyosin [Massariosphaeria phaeospora]|uniref:Tropomyosin n=1 Tax=Massariosphaeria phaeospora TaxID=100035 RepID=A0A7C8MWS2_9PLEO|nr:tropomyosin [Massariosphaeria phaeospora]
MRRPHTAPTPCYQNPCLTRVPQRMEALRMEADDSATKAEEFKAKVKTLEAETTQKEQEITSLTHRNQVLEGEVEKLETSVKTYKDEAGAGAAAGSQAESMQRKIQVLEEEAEESDRTIRELNEKLRQTDVKAGHFERKVQALEQSRDQWETKYEEMSTKYKETKDELDKFVADMSQI